MTKQYAGNKKLSDIKAAVIKNGWPWFQENFDTGSDYVTFGFMHDKKRFEVVYNTFNGTFLVKNSKGQIKTERSTECDRLKWYVALMDFIYVSNKAKAV